MEDGTLVYKTPYNPGLVSALKALVPASDRKWDPQRKIWLVAPDHGLVLVSITEQFLGEKVSLPPLPTNMPKSETRILELKYIGATKDRGDGSRTAFGWIGGEWAVIFPEEVLKAWFNIESRPGDEQTLYGALGLKQSATPLEIKKAFRRLSLQWHPDRCREPDAAEQFIKIKHANDILADPNTRARYNAGLALAATQTSTGHAEIWGRAGYRAPLRCGLIMATGIETIGRFVVSEIHAWEDITNHNGRVLVASWIMGADAPEESWI